MDSRFKMDGNDDIRMDTHKRCSFQTIQGYYHYDEVNISFKIRNGETRPVSYSRDCQEVPLNDGKKIFQTMDSFMNRNTILEHFEYYDIRQDSYEKNSSNKN